jgi:hypothetical protein
MKKLMLLAVLAAISLTTYAQVGVGTATPHASAALDVTSTTKGLLPPRMTQTQRNAISTPMAGLMVYCTNCGSGEPQYYNGTSWLNMVGGGAHTIGESYGGGIVFWVTSDGLHGLIAETRDQSTGSTWYTAQDLISQNSTHSPAGQSYTDWRLPTKNELNLLYLQKALVGSLASGYYWSSSENDNTTAWGQNFDAGNQFRQHDPKSNSSRVRAVRAF